MRQHELPKEAPATAIYENTRVYYHKVGETADSDRAVFGPDVDPSLQLPKAGFVNTGPLPGTSRLIAGQSRGTIETPALWLREPVGDAHWKPIAGHEDGVIDFASKGTILYVLTKAKSPNGRVVKFDAAKEDMAHAREILPESDLILTSSGESGIASAADALYVYGRRNGTSVMLRVPYDDPAKKEEIHLPFSALSLTSVLTIASLACCSPWTDGPSRLRFTDSTQPRAGLSTRAFSHTTPQIFPISHPSR
jgi:hypothetical protein